MKRTTWVWVSLVALGLGMNACGGGDSTTGVGPGNGGSGATAGASGGGGKAGNAGASGTAGKGGTAGTGGAAGTGGGTKVDADGDGYDQSSDCNDNDAKVHPGAQEVCNGIDDNCNAQIDEGVSNIYYVDQDGDTYGVDNPATNLTACTAPLGFSSKSGDCDDTNKAVNPGEAEICNGIDDNCNSQIDETGKTVWYIDADADGYGVDDAATNQLGCGAPPGYAGKAGDCNDADPSINPGTPEIAGNTVDENCDSVVEPCLIGLIECAGNVERHCDANGLWTAQVDCGAQICSTSYGCVNCLPGTATCNGATSHMCLPDGSGYLDTPCDPLMGSNCDQGMCTGPCAPQALGKSYIGCDYYPTVTMNSQLTNLSSHFAVAVSNTTTTAATVTVTQGATTVATVTVAPDSVQVVNLPWTALRTAAATTLTANGAYRLRSTQPVTVYQFNPLEYTTSGGSTFTNDASLLLPVTAWNVEYIVASRNNWLWNSYNLPGFYAVVASQDGTAVTLTPSPTGGSVRAGAGVPANGAATVTLNAGSVLQVLSQGAATFDLTGTRVTSNKPVEVISGHDCTFVPATVGYCDHLEEAMFPLSTLSKEYIVSAPSLPTQAQPKAAFTRVIATEAATALTYEPPNAAYPATIAAAGGYIELDNASAFRITADKKVLVVQYMKGQDAGGNSGDPAMALAVTTQQFRKDYLFHAPTNYEKNYVNVISPAGANVLLDNVAVGGFVAIGTTGYGVARVLLGNNVNGNHRLTTDQKAGITVYGYGQYTSYWYPGGLNLADL
ncbi:MAG: hypothetical protein HY898_25805 [Deltaproteobacteria bacterium]|nr:hypothetical protein [Deltaproteobacteria bacterium]